MKTPDELADHVKDAVAEFNDAIDAGSFRSVCAGISAGLDPKTLPPPRRIVVEFTVMSQLPVESVRKVYESMVEGYPEIISVRAREIPQ